MVKIFVDAMGGDNAPAATVAGAVQALKKDGELYVILAGKVQAIEAELKKYDYPKARLEIRDLPDVIAMDENPALAIRKKTASLTGGFIALKEEDDICGLVTAGSTGAAIACGQLILKNINGIKRAALCPAIPNSRGSVTLLCDCGANAECKSVMLAQFAVLASAYAKVAFKIDNPVVGLLNNGTEEHKGDPLHLETFKLLSKMKGINFAGNVEGRDIMIGNVDVVVADGFSGNIALKSLEGCGKMVLGVMKEEFSSSLRSKIGYLFLKKSLKNMRGKIDFEKFGGALLLGLKKVVVKSHGSSKASTIEASILNAAAIYRGGLVPAVEEMLSGVNLDELVPAEE